MNLLEFILELDNRIRYLIEVKIGITYVISHNYAKIKVDSYNFLSLEEALTFHNVTILIKGALSERQFLATESSLKIIDNTFPFTLKALFVLKIFNFCLDILVM